MELIRQPLPERFPEHRRPFPGTHSQKMLAQFQRVRRLAALMTSSFEWAAVSGVIGGLEDEGKRRHRRELRGAEPGL